MEARKERAAVDAIRRKDLTTGIEALKPHEKARVQFATRRFEGTVIETHADGSFDVLFPSDGSVVNVVPHTHQYKKVERQPAGRQASTVHR